MSETFLKQEHKSIIVPGFQLYRKDRKYKGGGGVAILVRNHYSVNVIEVESEAEYLETLILKVQVNNNKSFLLMCVYRPPIFLQARLQADSESFETILSSLKFENKNIIITGDFNLPSSNTYSYFEHILHSYSLTQIVNLPTRQENILDLFITNNTNVITNISIEEPHISDHRMIVAKLVIPRPVYTKKKITFRDYKNVNFEELGKEICKLEVPNSQITTSTLVQNFTASILQIFDTHAPFKTTTITDFPKKICPSNETLEKKAWRDKSYRSAIADPTEDNVNRYAKLNKEVKTMLEKDYKNNLDCLISKRGVYEAVKTFCKIKNSKASASFDIDVNTINNYFIKISTNDENDPLRIPMKHADIVSPENTFVLSPVSKMDVHRAWKSMKKKDSSSIDTSNLTPKMIDLSIGAPNISEYIVKIVNSSIDESHVPDSLKLSKVIPLAKVDKPTDPSQLRPISIQCVIGKIIEKCIASQLVSFLTDNNILSNNQFGFRAKHSTSHAHVALTDYLYEEIDAGNVCLLVSLDLSKAFDKVNRKLLLHKMKLWYNIDTRWFESYLQNRTQYVIHNNNSSNVGSTDIGVPQGGILSCILFAILLNDLPLYLKNLFVLLFADDTNFAISGPPERLPMLLEKVKQTMEIIIEWMEINRLQLNVSKTQMILVGKPALVKQIGPVSVEIGSEKITSVNKVKSLGLIIDSELKWVDHVKLKTRESNSVLWSLYPMQSSISNLNRKLIVNAYILPVINYMSIIWGTSKTVVVKIIESLIRRCGRFVLGLNKFDSVKLDISEKLKWLFPINIYKYKVLKLAYSIITNTCPPYFTNYLDVENIRLRNTRNKQYVNISHPLTSYGRRSFKYNATLSLPVLNNPELESVNVKSFSSKLKTYLLDKQTENSLYNITQDECQCDYSCIDDVVNFVYYT